jgi:Xaa-Pro aminopeptidase
VNARLQRLRARMEDLHLEAILITQAENRRYISGFSGSTGTLLVTSTQALFITDFRYYEQVSQECPEFTLIKQPKSFRDSLRQAARRCGVKSIAFESHDVSVNLAQDMQEALAGLHGRLIAELVPVSGVVEPLRMVKDEGEIELIARAARITDAALVAALPVIVSGMTEVQAAWEIERRMREMGADGVAFELIVASGPNSALPHARPSQRQLQEREPIVIDIGARVSGYCSDMTRTICLGKPPSEFRTVYDTVLKAQEAALAVIRAGGPTDKECDAAARGVIEQAGYGKRFGHSLGHGVGLQVHESPRLSPLVTEPKPLEAGVVTSVEPGIYLPGWGGVRIEDLVVVTDTGVRNLCSSPK